MTFPAKGLPELVPAQPEGERLRVDRLVDKVLVEYPYSTQEDSACH